VNRSESGWWGDGSFGTKNSVKEYLSLFQVVAILISGLEASFGKNSEEDDNGIFKHDNRALQPVYFNWDAHSTRSTLLNSEAVHEFWNLPSKDVILRRQVANRLFLHNAQKGKITCIALNLCGLLRHFCHF